MYEQIRSGILCWSNDEEENWYMKCGLHNPLNESGNSSVPLIADNTKPVLIFLLMGYYSERCLVVMLVELFHTYT